MRLAQLSTAALLIAAPVAVSQQPASAVRARAALDIPRQVDTLRSRGVPEDQIRVVMDEVRRRRVPATETRDILVESNKDARDHGPVNNFGAFVQAQLASGKRGRALASAIRAEHQRRGIGKGKANVTSASGERSRAGSRPSTSMSNQRSRAGATKPATGRNATKTPPRSTKVATPKATSTKSKAPARTPPAGAKSTSPSKSAASKKPYTPRGRP